MASMKTLGLALLLAASLLAGGEAQARTQAGDGTRPHAGKKASHQAGHAKTRKATQAGRHATRPGTRKHGGKAHAHAGHAGRKPHKPRTHPGVRSARQPLAPAAVQA